jgi:hypothetical protein
VVVPPVVAGGGGGCGVDGVERAGADGVVDRGQELLDSSARLRNATTPPALLVGNSQNTHAGKSVGISTSATVGISVGKQQDVQQKQQVSRIDWYRYELDFRPLKSAGYTVRIRKRLRWSGSRYSKMIVKRTCPRLTKKMVEQISVGKFLQATVSALQEGGIQDGFIRSLQERIGKGNGRRKAELTDLERSLLARIESSIRASG